MKSPILTLQENASGFFDKIAHKYSSSMKCAEGCSKCCFTDISIFEVEASRIKEWIDSQSIDDQDALKKLWQSPVAQGACAFLYNDRCSIYEARPIICRTQGAPLFIPAENVLDYCPLNFEEGDPPKEDWLNLDRLNTLLSFAAKTAGEEKRVSLKKLKKMLIS
jgi:hypothetical protein